MIFYMEKASTEKGLNQGYVCVFPGAVAASMMCVAVGSYLSVYPFFLMLPIMLLLCSAKTDTVSARNAVVLWEQETYSYDDSNALYKGCWQQSKWSNSNAWFRVFWFFWSLVGSAVLLVLEFDWRLDIPGG